MNIYQIKVKIRTGFFDSKTAIELVAADSSMKALEYFQLSLKRKYSEEFQDLIEIVEITFLEEIK